MSAVAVYHTNNSNKQTLVFYTKSVHVGRRGVARPNTAVQKP